MLYQQATNNLPSKIDMLFYRVRALGLRSQLYLCSDNKKDLKIWGATCTSFSECARYS